MNIQELKTKISGSSMTEDKKAKIQSLLDGTVTMDTIEQVKDLIQEDIDNDMLDILTEDDKKEIGGAEEELSKDLQKVEDELAKDMTFVEREMNDLSENVKTLNKAMDDAKIDALKASMALPQ